MKALMAGLVVGTGLFVLVAATWQPPDPEPAPTIVHDEPAWLTKDAAARILGPNGTLGPLFEGATLGGSAPSPATRARIAAFAKANHVDIGLEIKEDELRAVTFEVVFGGCCGYEGADVLAMRMGRPRFSECCGCDREWINDWVANTDDGAHMRARVRINRVSARWQPMTSLPELLDRAERMIGQRAAAIGRAEGANWREVVPGTKYLLETPFPFVRDPGWINSPQLEARRDLGLAVRVDAGAITEVSFAMPELDDDALAVFDKRWGKSRDTDDGRMWRKPGRVITTGTYPTTITIAGR